MYFIFLKSSSYTRSERKSKFYTEITARCPFESENAKKANFFEYILLV